MTKTMPSPLTCAYEIKLPVNTTIKLEFVEMDLENNCDVTNVGVNIILDLVFILAELFFF